MRDKIGRFTKGHQENLGNRKGLFLICLKCEKTFYVPQGKGNAKYCSRKCFKGHPGYNTGRTWFKKGHKVSKETQKKINEALEGHIVSEETRIKIREANKQNYINGRNCYIKGKTYTEVGRICKIKGENNPNWQGGRTKEVEKIRKSPEYRLWRTAVFARDNYICIWCGKKGGTLNADHIKPFSLFPELRFIIDNGRTLCEKCHKKTDTYLKKFSNDKREKTMVL